MANPLLPTGSTGIMEKGVNFIPLHIRRVVLVCVRWVGGRDFKKNKTKQNSGPLVTFSGRDSFCFERDSVPPVHYPLEAADDCRSCSK